METQHCLHNQLMPVARRLVKATDEVRRAKRDRSTATRNITCDEAEAETVGFNWTTAEALGAIEGEEVWTVWSPTASSDLPPDDLHSRGLRDLFWEPDTNPAMRITLIDNFLSESECAEMVGQARPRLAPATHAGEVGAPACPLARSPDRTPSSQSPALNPAPPLHARMAICTKSPKRGIHSRQQWVRGEGTPTGTTRRLGSRHGQWPSQTT